MGNQRQQQIHLLLLAIYIKLFRTHTSNNIQLKKSKSLAHSVARRAVNQSTMRLMNKQTVRKLN